MSFGLFPFFVVVMICLVYSFEVKVISCYLVYLPFVEVVQVGLCLVMCDVKVA